MTIEKNRDYGHLEEDLREREKAWMTSAELQAAIEEEEQDYQDHMKALRAMLALRFGRTNNGETK